MASLLVSLLLALAVTAARADEADDTDATSPAASGAATAEPSAADREIEELVGPQVEETLVVTASRSEETLLEVPVSVTVVDAGRIAATPGDDVADVLRGVPGLNIVQLSARDINITPRGATGVFSQGTLALVDGRAMNEPNNGLVLWDRFSFDLDEIEQIEVVNGPGSVVWGADALHGVINIRTKSPRETPGGRLVVGAGETGTRLAKLRWAQAGDKVAWKISAGWYEQDAWKRSATLPDGTPLPSAFLFPGEGTEQPRVQARVDVDLERDRSVSVSGGWAGMSGLIFTDGQPLVFRPSTYSADFGVRYQAPGVDVNAYWTRNDAKTRNAISGDPVNSSNDVMAVDTTFTRDVGARHRLVYGASLRNVRFDIDVVPETSRLDGGAFLEDRILVGNRVSLNLGSRFDHFETFGWAVSPRASVVVRTRDRQAVRFSWSQAYRAPTPVETDLVIANTTYVDAGLPDPVPVTLNILGNPKINEQVSDGFEIGWTATLPGHLVNVSLYRKEVSDFIELFPVSFYSADNPPAGWPLPPEDVPPGLIETLSYRNVGHVRDQGLEVSVQSHWSELLDTQVSYTWQDDPRVRDAPGLINRPPHQMATLRFGLHRGRWRGTVGGTWTDRAFWADAAGFTGYTKSYFLGDAQVAVSWGENGRAELALGVTDLFDQKVQQHLLGDVIRRKATLEARFRF